MLAMMDEQSGEFSRVKSELTKPASKQGSHSSHKRGIRVEPLRPVISENGHQITDKH